MSVILIGVQLNHLLAPAGSASNLGMLVMGVFTMIALIGACRGGVKLDLDAGKLVRWRGFLIPMTSTTFPFSQIEYVLVSVGIFPGSLQAARRRDYNYNVAIFTPVKWEVVLFAKDLEHANRLAQSLATMIGCDCKSDVGDDGGPLDRPNED